jgi:hypothetical protein
MSHTHRPGPDDPTRDAELSAAVAKFLELLDDGLTKEKLEDFLRRYEGRSPQFRSALKQCIILAGAPPIEAVEELKSALKRRPPRGTKTRG